MSRLSPTILSRAVACSRAAASGLPPKRSSRASVTLPSAVRHGTSRGDWNT